MNDPVHFTTLGEDIHHIILAQINNESPLSLPRLARASKKCKAITDPYLYHTIELSDEDEKMARTGRMVRRLLDTNDVVLQHVVNLRIADFAGASDVFTSSALEQIIGNLSQLQSFSWNALKPIPECVISKLEACWPHARLCVTNHRRWKSADTEMNMDTRLLSSPLLYSLRYSIFYIEVGQNLMTHSELPKLAKILVKSSRLRILYIKLHLGLPIYSNDRNRYKVDLPQGVENLRPLNLPLCPADHFSPLQELKFQHYPPYNLSREHCEVWTHCMDWSRLRRLDLGSGCPQNLLEQLCGRVPKLKSLRFGTRPAGRQFGTWICLDVAVARAFLDSIDGLQELFITNDDDDTGLLFPEIMAHCKSLRTLAFHTKPDCTLTGSRRKRAPVWTFEQLEQLYQHGTQLSHLEIDIGLVDGNWPSEKATLLARFTHLRTMKLYVQIDESASSFSDKYSPDVMESIRPPPLKEDLCKKVAAGLFRQVFENDPYARLTHLELCFTRRDLYDRGEAAVVESSLHVWRLERDDAPRPEEGGYRIEYEGKYRVDW